MMGLTDLVTKQIQEHQDLIRAIRSDLMEEIVNIATDLADRLGSGSTIFWCGNGGSAADSQHLAAELVGRYRKTRKPLRSVALTTDTSVLTCISNDFSYADIFSRQLEALASEGDVLISISTSGNSTNILRAIQVGRDLNVRTIALLGQDGGKAKNYADYSLVVPCDSTARIQEAHILIGHILCELIEKELNLGQ